MSPVIISAQTYITILDPPLRNVQWQMVNLISSKER